MRFRRLVLSAGLVAALGVGSYACFGKFAATHGLYNWNKQVSGNKFVQSLVMWGLIIIPAYELFSFGDFIIFNVIEFWTGDNVLADASEGGDTQLVEVERDSSGTVTLRRGAREFVLRPVDDRRISVSIDGKVVGMGEIQEDESLVLYDQRGQVIRTLFPGDLQEVQQNLDQLPIVL